MGCDSYGADVRMDSGGWTKTSIRFSDVLDDGPACLCTLGPKTEVYPEDVRSMAYLGAAVVLAHHGYLGQQDAYLYLPDDLPHAVKAAIDRCFPTQGQ